MITACALVNVGLSAESQPAAADAQRHAIDYEASKAAVEYALIEQGDEFVDARAKFKAEMPKVRNFCEYGSRLEIAHTRRLVLKAKAISDQYRANIVSSHMRLEQELRKRDVPADLAQKAAAGYKSQQQEFYRKSEQLRVLDELYFKALLGLLDLANEYFGTWSPVGLPKNQQERMPPLGFRFDAEEANLRYRELYTEMTRITALENNLSESQTNP